MARPANLKPRPPNWVGLGVAARRFRAAEAYYQRKAREAGFPTATAKIEHDLGSIGLPSVDIDFGEHIFKVNWSRVRQTRTICTTHRAVMEAIAQAAEWHAIHHKEIKTVP